MMSERRACLVVGQSRSTQRRQPKVRADEGAALTAAIVQLATRYGRYGYRRIRRLLLDEGWHVSVNRIYRIWRREGLKVPAKHPSAGGCGSTTARASGCDRSTQSRVVVRLHAAPHRGREALSHAHRDRRVHTAMFGHRRGTQTTRFRKTDRFLETVTAGSPAVTRFNSAMARLRRRMMSSPRPQHSMSEVCAYPRHVSVFSRFVSISPSRPSLP